MEMFMKIIGTNDFYQQGRFLQIRGDTYWSHESTSFILKNNERFFGMASSCVGLYS